MKLEGYGVILEQLREADLELLRGWRNAPHIQKTMLFRETITPEQQIAWFRGLDPEKNLYFMLRTDGPQIGMANLKNIDLAAGSAEVGMFIYDLENQNSVVSYGASLNLLDHAFTKLGLTTVVAKNLTDNTRALRYNQSLGFTIERTVGDVHHLELNEKNYLKKRGLLEKYLGVSHVAAS